MRAWIVSLCVAGFLGGCAGLNQFPDVSADYRKDLNDLDPDYDTALEDIKNAAGNLSEQGRIRNEEIDRRIRVIDLNFTEFQAALAKENVGADFLVGVAGVGAGGVGALVSETASQILSAVSGGLAGTKAAYAEAALFERTLSALLAQMIAGRNSVLVRIYEGRTLSIEEYPLSAAVRDLEAYYFAGSIPGAVVATSADAKVKNDEAEKELENLRSEIFGDDENTVLIEKFLGWDGRTFTNTANKVELDQWKLKNGLNSVSNTLLLSAVGLADKRREAVRYFKLRP